MITGFDLTTIGKDESVAEILSRIPVGIPEPDVKTIQTLLRRLTNDNVLSEMGLIYRGGRIKMDYAPGTELVSPEELKLLSKLARLPLNDGDKQ